MQGRLIDVAFVTGGERRAHLRHRRPAFFRYSRNETHDGIRGALDKSQAAYHRKLETDRCAGRHRGIVRGYFLGNEAD